MINLESSKIRLRAYRREDIKDALSFINDPEVSEYLRPGIPFPMKLENEEKWYESIDPMSTSNYSFAIETKDKSLYIGGCGINETDWKNSWCVVGIFLGKRYWNKGYGTDAMKTLVNFIFNEMNMNKIKLNVYSFNKRAVKSYEKCGFVTEGILKQEFFRNGQYHDEYIMSILKSDYIKNPGL